MQIRKSDDLWVKQSNDGTVYSNFSGNYIAETDNDRIEVCKRALAVARNRSMTEDQKNIVFDCCLKEYKSLMPSEEIIKEQERQKNLKLDSCEKLINFFKDFEFEPNFRFVNTLFWHSKSVESARQYVFNYFNLTDNQYKLDVVEKMKSKEFSDIISEISQIKTDKKINSRFKVYYGSQGTGKTTKAMEESNYVVVICHSAMLPSDLLEDFGFDDGKAGFHKSALWKAMENGTSIVLDEINLLPFESIRFLQGLVDGKKEIVYKGQTIKIKDGFQIIGTMNLVLNGSAYGLTEPLVDRAYDIKEFKLTNEQLAGAF